MVPILIVDDAAEDMVFAQRVLAGNRILNPVFPLSGGQACLDYLAGKSQQFVTQLPCVVLLDLVMKPVSGLDVLRKLKRIPAAQGSIVVMLSGLTDIKMVAEGYRLGASTFLIKPLVAAELKQRLGTVNGLNLTKVAHGHIVGITGCNLIAPAEAKPLDGPSLGAQ